MNSNNKGFESFEVLEKFGCGWVLGWRVATDSSPGLEYLEENELRMSKKMTVSSHVKKPKPMDWHDQWNSI